LTIRPLLCDSLSWSYKTIFMFVVVLVLLCTRVSWHEGVPPGDSQTRSAPQDWVGRAKGMKGFALQVDQIGGTLESRVSGLVMRLWSAVEEEWIQALGSQSVGEVIGDSAQTASL
jgi:predicted small integral membrane protein